MKLAQNFDSLSFLDIKSCRKNGKFVISIYKKPTFSGVLTNYENFIQTYISKEGTFTHITS